MQNNVSTPGTNAPTRFYYLDWLRVFAMIGIFFFHNARFYDVFSGWHLKNATTDTGPSIIIASMNEWIMPLFFLLAGAGTFYALRFRSAGQFAWERILRLLVPLIFGLLVWLAPQAYFEAVWNGANLSGLNFFQIYGYYLTTLPTLPPPWYHLWFLGYLFAFSIIALPLLTTWTQGGKSIVSSIADRLSNPWILLAVLVLSLTVVDTLLSPDGFWGNRNTGNWSIAAYLLFFVCGYLIVANASIMEAVKKLRWVWLGIAVIALVSILIFFLDVMIDRGAYFGSGIFVATMIVQAVSTWCLLLAILGLGARYLERSNRFLEYAGEAVLPFYILHQTVIISIGFYVLPLSLGVWTKYGIIAGSSFVIIMALYEIVRRVNVLRFLFGMRGKKRPQPEPVAQVETVTQ